jgi:FkbM family methyltransferase
MKILYGKTKFEDVTATIVGKPTPFFIPASDDLRWKIFGTDPEPGVLKVVLLEDDLGNKYVFNNTIHFSIELKNGKYSIINITEKLKYIHSTLSMKHGSLTEEFDEQIMATLFIQPTMRVLEIGGNVGRNSCVISKLLSNSSQLTVVESDPSIANCLYDNKRLNNLQFTIVDGAISKKQMIQNSWDTKYSEGGVVPEGWKRINTTSWENILRRHGPFDALVADCEGALYHILQEEPTFFSNFKTVLVENDYYSLENKKVVDEAMKKEGFHVAYEKGGGWGACKDFFYQAWKK